MLHVVAALDCSSDVVSLMDQMSFLLLYGNAPTLLLNTSSILFLVGDYVLLPMRRRTYTSKSLFWAFIMALYND